MLLGATGQISLQLWGMGSAQVCCIFLSVGLMKGVQSLSLLPLSGTTILLCASRVSLLGPYRQYTLNYVLAAEGIALSIIPHALILH